eukprot:Skav215355  [mRNA]  locus=scaffold1391:452646:454097:+ [translate_table: standard]
MMLSGAKYSGVPTKVFDCKAFLQHPKSTSLALPLKSKTTFSGFKSRYMMARAWRYSKARVMEPPKNCACLLLRFPISRMAVNKSPPPKNSVKKYTFLAS